MITIASPISGWIVPLEAVPDPVFAQRMLGDGVAIDPAEGVVRAPGDGKVVSVHPARHAVTIELTSGPVILIHVGLDTVALAGDGFEAHCSEGQKVKAGQILLSFDISLLARRARSLVTPVIVTNGDAFAIADAMPEGVIHAGEAILQCTGIAPQQPDEVAAAKGPLHSRTVRLPLAHGLHARPAARIAALCGEFSSRVELATNDGRSASCRSAVAMLALSLAHGSELTIKATGHDAVEAVDALAALLESGMGEFREVQPAMAQQSPAAAADVSAVLPASLSGLVAVQGTAFGPAHVLRASTCQPPRDADDSAAEKAALAQAVSRVREFLGQAASLDGAHASIAQAHLALLDDPEIEAQALEHIGAGRSAGHAWISAIETFAAPLRQSKDKRFAERVSDLEDISQNVLTALAGKSLVPDLPAPGAIVVAQDILPSQLMHLAPAGLSGLALGAGGATSHVAIIAAGMGLPMLCGLGSAVGLIAQGTRLALHDGVLRIDPSEAERAEAEASLAAQAELQRAASARAHEPAITRDGTAIEVFANLGSAADAHAAAREGAEGCGLLRTEFLFLDRPTPPDLGEQTRAYQEIADALGPRPLIVRTLDIGADKPVPWLAQPDEENPALGCRGIRLQLAYPELLETQLSALIAIRVPAGLRIMLPMVSDRAEIVAAREVLQRLADKAGRPAPELGIMVETPAAAVLAATLASEADFFSIGSNDLSQYVLARDRTAASVAKDLDGLHPAVLGMIAMTVDGANKHGRWTGLCGGLAADRLAVPILLGLGVSELSMPPRAVALVKHQVRGLDLDACRALARDSLAAPDAQTVRALARAMLEQNQ